jgi:hypothetical protein
MHLSVRRLASAGFGGLLVVFAAIACDSPTGLGSGRLNLLLTDAPGDVLKAVVTIDRIYLQPSEDSDVGRVVLLEDDVTTDLLTLADSLHALIEGASIPEGSYSQLRFVISGAYLEVEGAGATNEIYATSPTYAGLPAGAAVTGHLQMPSIAQTGIKVNLPGDAVSIGDDDVVTLVVDFDVSQSFGKAAGASGKWVMTPVLHGSIPPTL